MNNITRLSVRIAALLLTGLAAGAGLAQSTPGFYAGRTLNIVVSSSAGGYYDMAGRAVARHLGKFIPGNPSVVVQNMPGTSGLALGNRLANTAEKDGATIYAMNRAIPQLAIAGDPNVAFDPVKLTWLGSLSSYENDGYLLTLNAQHPAKTFADALKPGKPIHLGATRAGATNIIFGLIAHDLLKMNTELIRGYPGAAEIFLAMESNELDGQVIDLSAILVGRPTMWKEGKLRPLVVFGRTSRMPDLPDVPTARELISDPNDLALLEFAEMPFFMALPFAAPPGIPADRAAILKDGFMKMARDPAFRADILKTGILTSPVDGATVQALIEKASGTPSDVTGRFARMIADQ